MNTADRSIALVDHALRRRFAFFELKPEYEVLESYHQDSGFKVESLIQILKEINAAIADPHYALGITYFLVPEIEENLEAIWTMEVLPYLEEFDPKRSEQYLRQLSNPAEMIQVSAKSGEGLEQWLAWLRHELAHYRRHLASGTTLTPALQPEGQQPHSHTPHHDHDHHHHA